LGAQAADPRASTTADQRPFGMLQLRAAEPSSRALQAAGGLLHGATWPREDRRVYLDHAYWLSRYSAAQPERSGSLIQVVCLSSQRN